MAVIGIAFPYKGQTTLCYNFYNKLFEPEPKTRPVTEMEW